ncbi:MAG: hypothetical protein HXY51_10555 [Nitrospirae bacterium]|nr:hypothetical protein [Nitrospirota bacterium]
MWCAVGLVCFLAGCSFLSLYRYADWVILWQADHYLDLTSDQRHDLSQRLTPLLARHRHEALPQYETVLMQGRQRLERGLTSQDIDWVYANYDRLRADLFDRVIADSGVVLASVDSRQVRTLEAAFQKDHAKVAQIMQAPAPERLKKRADAIIDWLDDWLGSLSKDQEARIRQWALALPDNQQFWASYQQQRQQELLALLRQPHTPKSVARELSALLVVYPDQTGPPAYQEAIHQMRTAVKTMALAVDQQATLDQRRHAVTKLQRLIDQLHELQGE